MIDVNTIYTEDCRDTLAKMPDNFLDMCITSPPYYGLRKYSVADTIWDGEKNCKHVFTVKDVVDKRGCQPTDLNGRDPNQIENRLHYSYSVCRQCKAWKGQLGLEPTFQLYIKHLIDIFRKVKRVLKPTGTVWVNLGDSYTSSGGASRHRGYTDPKYPNGRNGEFDEPTAYPQTTLPKSLMNIPARFAIAMTDELQFIQRNQINWHKPSCMPSSAKDRFTIDFEPIFFFAKSQKYYFEQQLEEYTQPLDRWGGNKLQASGKSLWDEGTGQSLYRNRDMRPNAEGRNKRTTWTVNYEPSSENHFASYPTKLLTTPILAGCPIDGIVYDPFAGTGTTLEVAHRLGRKWIGSDLSIEYAKIMTERLTAITAQTSLF